MDGPYRDLGSGFARLTGSEAPRRAPSPISHVEDALLELLRNARDAGAENIHVASTLRGRRYRTLTVIDDGAGVPGSHTDLIFEPGVTTRHLDPVRDPGNSSTFGVPHGAGLALHHIKNAALEARVVHASSPTSIRTVFDTTLVPERSLQSETRPSQTNLLATATSFAKENPRLSLFFASPAMILASLLKYHIIQTTRREEGASAASVASLAKLAGEVGIEVSSKTVRRILGGGVAPAERVREGGVETAASPSRLAGISSDGPSLVIGDEERASIAAILGRAARASYLEVAEVEFQSRPGEVSVTARIHEPEDEYG